MKPSKEARFMTRYLAPVLLLVLSLSHARAAHAQLDAPVWYVQYRVTVKADFTQPDGAWTRVYKVDNSFATTVKLDMRNQGQVLSLNMQRFDPEKMKNMTPADQLKLSQDMLNAMQDCANWMQGPIEGLDDTIGMRNHMIAVSVPVRIHYELTANGHDVVDEMGSHWDSFEQTTASFSGGNVYTSPDQARFEMNTATKKYWLSLPFTFQDMNDPQKEIEWVTVRKSKAVGAAAWDPEERSTSSTGLDLIGDAFRPDPPFANGGLIPVIEGTLDSSGRISGERSYTGHTARTGPNVPVTLTYRYTVTQTPPAKK
jgi:hypothetical protein